jgi:DNA invertase Pin-like site-specific DNA recombinase
MRNNLPPSAERKINSRHYERLAVVYVRQSSVHQVQQHQESTQLQYGLADHAERLGWSRERVLVIDDDLGVSGASSEGRFGFQRLLGEVALDHVGVILGVEMSRLARSCKDWYQLLELCALFDTLICDLDGLYDPSCYNDRLLLGLKGTMSEAELHVIQQRMWQGALQKAQRGELPSKGPIGYVRTGNQLIFDPDEQAQAIVRMIFDQFDRIGTVHGVLRYLVDEGIRMPIRLAAGFNKGQLEWRRPNLSALQNILSHPVYAGAYVFGRSTQSKKARQRKTPYRLPRDEWLVLLRDRHPGYISWSQYEENQVQLAANRSHYRSRCSIGQGRALLAGLVVCARCGRRFDTQYCGPKSQPTYRCAGNSAIYAEPTCQSLRAQALDDEVARLAMKALEPSALEVSLRVANDLQQQRDAAEQLWRQRLERAAYEVERAARQYHAVEPENRLVARTLERTWEEKLRFQRDLEEQHGRFQREQPETLTPDEQERIRKLAGDVPTLWNAAGTKDADRKAVLREIIDRVVINIEGESEWVEAWVHWAGGRQTYTRFLRPVSRITQLSTGKRLLERVRELLSERVSAPKIADRLNAEGLRTSRGLPFNEGRVRMLMVRHGLRSARQRHKSSSCTLGKDEWFIPDLVHKLHVGYHTIYQWRLGGQIEGRKGEDGRWIVTADETTCRRLTTFQARQRQVKQRHESASENVERRCQTMTQDPT